MAILVALLCAVAVLLAVRGALGVVGAPRLRVLQGLAATAAPSSATEDPESLSRPFSERVLRPALGTLGGLLGRLLPARLLASTATLLQRSGLRGRPADWVGAKLLIAVALGGYGLLLAHRLPVAPLLALVAGVLGWALPGVYLQSHARRRAMIIRDDLPDAMDLLTVCVEAGLGFDQALTRVVERYPGPVGEEFGHVLRDQRLGTPRRPAMLAVVERVDLPELRAFIHALLQAEELGVRIGAVLRVQSDSLREQRRQRAEEAAMKAPVKMAFPMILLILPALFLVVLGPAIIQAVGTLKASHP